MARTQNRQFHRFNTITVKFFGTFHQIAPHQIAPHLAAPCLIAFCLILILLPAEALAADPSAADETQIVFDDDPASNSVKGAGAPAKPSDRVNHSLSEIAQDERSLLLEEVTQPTPIRLPVKDSEVVAFWAEDLSGAPKGALLILAEPGQIPTESVIVNDLQSTLPKHGWVVLSLHLPEQSKPRPPKRSTAPYRASNQSPDETKTAPPEKIDETQVVFEETEPAIIDAAALEDSPNNEAISPTEPPKNGIEYQAFVNDAISAGLGYLNENSQFNVVLVGVGINAYTSLAFINQASTNPEPTKSIEKQNQKALIDRSFQAVVLINLQLPVGAQAAHELMGESPLPMLDLFIKSTKDNPSVLLRQTAAKKHGYQNYVKRGIYSTDLTTHPQSTVKIIRGFLTQHASGVTM